MVICNSKHRGNGGDNREEGARIKKRSNSLIFAQAVVKDKREKSQLAQKRAPLLPRRTAPRGLLHYERG